MGSCNWQYAGRPADSLVVHRSSPRTRSNASLNSAAAAAGGGAASNDLSTEDEEVIAVWLFLLV